MRSCKSCLKSRLTDYESSYHLPVQLVRMCALLQTYSHNGHLGNETCSSRTSHVLSFSQRARCGPIQLTLAPSHLAKAKMFFVTTQNKRTSGHSFRFCRQRNDRMRAYQISVFARFNLLKIIGIRTQRYCNK